MNPMLPDLKKALAKSPKAQAAWNNLTQIAQRDFISWISSAKQEETRKRRVKKAVDMLLSGKRRPCCYARVPMDLYTLLGKNPKAQAQWKALTPNEKRDLVDWIEEEKEAVAQTKRLVKVSQLLAAGKRKP